MAFKKYEFKVEYVTNEEFDLDLTEDAIADLFDNAFSVGVSFVYVTCINKGSRVSAKELIAFEKKVEA